MIVYMINRYRGTQSSRMSRRGTNEEGGEREYHTRPREATPSFLRESIDVPPGLNEDMKMCYKYFGYICSIKIISQINHLS